MILWFVSLSLFLLLFTRTDSAPASSWHARTIYQLLTDRFARPNSSSNPFGACSNLNDYCGGTFDGIEQHLDYIESMGFDAIWISPIVANTAGGYHGYWMQDLFAINPHFGSLQQMLKLVTAAHKRNMLVMLDVVANHVGPVGNNFASIQPFNDSVHYHSCSSCPAGCAMAEYDCFTHDIQICRLDDLPDLNQSVPFVSQQLCKFATLVTQTYGFDGLRIDTTPEVDRAFWSSFVACAGRPFVVGEVFSSDVGCVEAYQRVQGGVLSYPLFFAIRDVFTGGQSMTDLTDVLNAYASSGLDMNNTGVFLGNHDNARFLNVNDNELALKSAAVFIMTAPGVPIWYYGDEQFFSQNSRAPLWPTKFSRANLVPWLKIVIGVRKSTQLWAEPFILLSGTHNQFFAYQRGQACLVLLTNQQSIGRLHHHVTTTFDEGTVLCNVFWPTVDCITVGSNGSLSVYLDNGEAKIYVVS